MNSNLKNKYGLEEVAWLFARTIDLNLRARGRTPFYYIKGNDWCWSKVNMNELIIAATEVLNEGESV